jgi:hypothetical protein
MSGLGDPIHWPFAWAYGAYARGFTGESDDTRDKLFFDMTIQTALAARLAAAPPGGEDAIDAGRYAVRAAGAALEERQQWWEECRKRRAEEYARQRREDEERREAAQREQRLRLEAEYTNRGPTLYDLRFPDRAVPESLANALPAGWQSRIVDITEFLKENPGWPARVVEPQRRAMFRKVALEVIAACGWQPPPPEVPSKE